MKKTIFATLMVCVLLITSCSKDGEGSSNSLVGQWDYVAYVVQGQRYEADACLKQGYMTFTETEATSVAYSNATGTCTSDVRNSTYTLSGDKIIANSSGNTREITYSISGDELTLTFLNDSNQQSISIYKRRNGSGGSTTADVFIGNWALKAIATNGQVYDITGANVPCFKNSTLVTTDKTFKLTFSVPKSQTSTECNTASDEGTWVKRNEKYYITQNNQEAEFPLVFNDGGNTLQFDYVTNNETMTLIFTRQ
ncbi:MAG: lipocalin family protein [Capnocytophaga sp.]|nr:lipocalin family protein [Capnocytophaga sp.]